MNKTHVTIVKLLSHCEAQTSSQEVRFWGIVPTRAQRVLSRNFTILDELFRRFCADFFAIFSFTVGFAANSNCNFAHEFETHKSELGFELTSAT